MKMVVEAVPIGRIEEDLAELMLSFWDWPLNEEGIATVLETKDKVSITLDFSYLKHSIEVRKFESWNGGSSWALGLRTDEDGTHYFWELDIQTQPHLNLIIIEASREIVEANSKATTTWRMRKMYKLPSKYDMVTMKTKLNTDGVVIFEANARQLSRRKISALTSARFAKFK